MKLSVIFLIAFAALLGHLQAQQYNGGSSLQNYNGRYDHFPHDGDHQEDRDSSHLPIPIISDKASAAIVQGSNMLAEAAKAAIANEVYDKTGVLTIIKTFASGVNLMMNTLFTKISGAVSTRLARHTGPGDALSDLIAQIIESGDEIREIIKDMKRNIKPSEWSEIVNAIEDIVKKVLSLDVFKPKVRFDPFNFDNLDFHEDKHKDKDHHYYQGLDLKTVIAEWSIAIEGIANSVQVLAKAVQKVITSRNNAITVQKSIHKSLSLSGSYLSSASTQLNSDLESIKSKLGQFAQTTVTQINQRYSSVTSNPSKWHHRLLSKLYDFLAFYSEFVHKEYLHGIASSFKEAEREIASEIIEQTRKCGLKIAKVGTHITDRSAASANPRAPSECNIKQISKLMASTNSLNRLAQCLSTESSNFHGMYSRWQQLLTLAKDNAVNIVSQLTICNSDSDKCYHQFSKAFDEKKDRAKDDLKSAEKQVEHTLEAITERVKHCLKSVAREIESTTEKCEKDFDFCLKF